MVSLLSRGVGLLVKSFAGLSCTQATRCSRLPGALTALQQSTTRWFSKQRFEDDLPKRPLSSYFRFVADQRPTLEKQYPEAKMTEIVKILGMEWRGLSESAKKHYVDAANEDLLKYKDEVRKYKEKLSPLELQLLSEKRKLIRLKKKHLSHRRELILLGKPKGARHAWNIYVTEHFQDTIGTKFSERMKNLHKVWKSLSDSQNQMYVQLAQDDKIRFENEMKAWEEQMHEIGRDDLIRHKGKMRLGKAAVMHKAKSKRELPKKVKKLTKPVRGGKMADEKE